MNKWALAAGVLSIVTIGLHVAGGGPEVHLPLLASAPSVILQTYVTVLWHAVTVVLIVNSAALCIAAFCPEHRKPLLGMVACQYAGYGLLFIGYGISRLGSMLQTPQWITFGVIASLALAGLNVGNSSADKS